MLVSIDGALPTVLLVGLTKKYINSRPIAIEMSIVKYIVMVVIIIHLIPSLKTSVCVGYISYSAEHTDTEDLVLINS